MSDTMLHAVLRMPPELWQGEGVDALQRHSRYVEASDRIIALEKELSALKAKEHVIVCAYCGEQFSANGGFPVEAVKAHVLVCDKRPEKHYSELLEQELARMREELENYKQSQNVAIECYHDRVAEKLVAEEKLKKAIAALVQIGESANAGSLEEVVSIKALKELGVEI